MKFSYKPSPNYRNTQSTSGIMLDLTLCLLAVLLSATVFYSVAYGAAYGMRVVGMTAASVITALLTEGICFKLRGSKDVKKDILHSYGWVTALILTCITRLDVSYYALIVATAICIIFGKLVFGGFGQNIFNPAAFGEALIMLYLSASTAAKVTADVFTSATPMTAMNSQGWILKDMGSFLAQYGGFGGLLTGSYPSVIGGSCAVVILLCGAFMLWKKDIDWHLSVTYLITVFFLSLVVGLIKGAGISYALFNVISGGVLFGTVFMMTDPVTTPITIPGRMIFAVGCATLTLILRWKANLPDGVLFSILLMNMLTPAIDKLVDGNQIKNQKLIARKVNITSLVFIILGLAVGMTVKNVNDSAAPVTPSNTPAPTADSGTKKPEATGFVTKDFSKYKAACFYRSNTDSKAVVYDCRADGFGLINDMGEGYSQNKAYITVNEDEGKIVSVEVKAFGDTKDKGDKATTADALKRFAGADVSTKLDAVSGATYTDESIQAMAARALAMATGMDFGGSAAEPAETKATGFVTEDYSKNNAVCFYRSNTDSKALVFDCRADGYGIINNMGEGYSQNKAYITVNGDEKKIVSVEVTSFGDTEGTGDKATAADVLKKYAGADANSKLDGVTGATFTDNSIKAMAKAALEMAAGK